MCGIAGFVTTKKRSTQHLRDTALNMSDAIRHRGPDGDGVWTDIDAGVALSHRRLAIVDLSPTGAQPITSGNSEWVLVYNGEIYNTENLKSELTPHNIEWRGTSDTEVIVEAISIWGVRNTVEKLIGMFAFAAWNKKDNRLYLVRDRLGIKPLYWSMTNLTLMFGSELKALRKHPDCPMELNRSTIAGYMRNCYVNNPATIYTGVQHLQPGWLLHWHPEDQNPVFEQYWSLENNVATGQANRFEGSDKEAISHLDHLLSDAVKRRMVSDVPLGAFLSGGIDSSTIVSLMQRHSHKPVNTFSIGFEESKYDESHHAAAVADHLGTHHTRLIITPQDALEVIPDLPTMFDEPFADPSQIPTYLLSKLTREHVTVALSGDGGDELFAGYKRYFDANKYSFLIGQPKLLRNWEALFFETLSPDLVKKISRYLPLSIASKLSGSKLRRIPPILRDGNKLSLYRRFLSRIENPEEILICCSEPEYSKWNQANSIEFGKDSFALMQFIDTLDYLPDDILTKVDRASMAVSLEARVPLLDHRVVEFAWTLPENLKVRNGKGKWILKNLLHQYLPEELVNRPKKGFSVPIGIWLKGPLKQWASELLSIESLRKTEIFKPAPIQKKWKEHLSGDTNWELHLWDVLCLQAWALKNI